MGEIRLAIPDFLQGCKVFPCVPGTKDPATKHGWKDASNDPAQIAEWLKINPDFNWAVATGLSGLFIIDVDPEGLRRWEDMQNENPVLKSAVSRAYTVRTPRGGLHVYFRGKGPSTASRIAPGIDTRGGIWKDDKVVSGGYVLLPGSRTVNGSYSVLGGHISNLPECVAAIVPERKKTDTLGLVRNPDHDQPRNVSWAIDLLKGYVASGRVSIEGKGGNGTAFQVAASIMDKAISPGLCADLMIEHWNPHCSPPWDEWEIETLVRNAAEYGEDTKSGVKGFQANADVFSSFAGMESEDPEPSARRSRFTPMWLSDARKDKKPQKWLVPGFIPEAGAGVLYGQSGSYKTFIALDWALTLAHGISGQWDAPPEKHTVLFLAGESVYALQEDRVNSWCEWQGVNPDDGRFVLVRGVPSFGDAEGWKEIRDGLLSLDARPDFIVVDTLTRMMTGMDENNNNDGKLILNHLEEMAQHYGAFVLGVGHTGKDTSKGIRGASSIINNSEVIHFAKKTQNGTALKVQKLKEVDEPAHPFYLEKKVFGNSIVLVRCEGNESEDEHSNGSRYAWASPMEILKVLESLGGSTSDAYLYAEIAGAHGIDKDIVRKHLSRNTELTIFRPTKGQWHIPKREYDL
jgi:hypothetical protein